jgi:hypothetical protein
MDPTECLNEIRRLCAYVRGYDIEESGVHGFEMAVIDLIEHIESLDEWLLKGGFKPVEWADPE